MKLVLLTTTEDMPLYINPDFVECVIGGGGYARIYVNGDPERTPYAVKESIDEVVQLLMDNLCEHVWEAFPPVGGGTAYAKCRKCGFMPSKT